MGPGREIIISLETSKTTRALGASRGKTRGSFKDNADASGGNASEFGGRNTSEAFEAVKDKIEIGGRGEGPFALLVRCSTAPTLAIHYCKEK